MDLWDDSNNRRRRKRMLQNAKLGLTTRVVYGIIHGISALIALGLIIISHFAEKEEKRIMGEIDLGVTGPTALFYRISSGVVFLAIIIGITAIYYRKPFPWLLYCTILVLVCLTQFSTAGTGFSNLGTYDGVSIRLKDVMSRYGKKTEKQSIEITQDWDRLQKYYKCCGVHSYKDWQIVDFGMTSLRVPPSCCLPQQWKNNKTYESCGQNMLPDHIDANKYIYTKGCLKKIMKNLDRQLYILDVYGIVTTVLFVLIIVFSCILVFTKRI